MSVLLQTPLFDVHTKNNAKIVPFAGWQMPIDFGSVLQEHAWTRSKAGLFDVSHMAIIDLLADDAAEVVEKITPASLSTLAVGQMRYGLFTNDEGGTVDDFMATQLHDGLRIISNASRRDEVLAYLSEHVTQTDIAERKDLALVALQGPSSAEVLISLGLDVADMRFMTSKSLEVDGTAIEVSRSGYTGEDGFELAVPAGQAEQLALRLLDHEAVKPVGLGARDTLRLEAGLCLYGNDLDETVSPVEAGLRWTIGKDRRGEGSFAGSQRIISELLDGPSRKRFGLAPQGKRPVRHGDTLHDSEGQQIGVVSSGTFGPTVKAPIAMGFLPTSYALGDEVIAHVRGTKIPCLLTTLPFVSHNYCK